MVKAVQLNVTYFISIVILLSPNGSALFVIFDYNIMLVLKLNYYLDSSICLVMFIFVLGFASGTAEARSL